MSIHQTYSRGMSCLVFFVDTNIQLYKSTSGCKKFQLVAKLFVTMFFFHPNGFELLSMVELAKV